MTSIFFFLIYGFLTINVGCYRLPTSIIPTHYKVQILPYLEESENFIFHGKVWITLECNSPTDNVTLHSQDLNISTITLKDLANDQVVPTKNFEFDTSNDFVIINLKEQVQKDHKYILYISFESKLTEDLKGLYRSSYVENATKKRKWLGVTQFEATSARKAFPCFDEPAMKAVFEIIMGRKNTQSSISNMPLTSSEPMKDKKDWYWDKFAPSVPMSTYLVAFIVSDFEFRTSEPLHHNNVTFRIWAKKDAIDQVDYAKEVGPKFLEYYEKFFDIKYPLPKQDMIAIPDFSAGAMENWGLITYREALLLFDPKLSSLSSQHRIANVIAHELAHQWFGNLVTMKWWTDLWLNEGFATYMASRAVEYLYPDWRSFEADAVQNILSVFSFDSLRTSHPVSVPIGDPKEIDEIFDTISYKKGSFLIRMMSLFLGDKTLRQGVSHYLKNHKYKNAEQDDLWNSLTKEAHKNKVLSQDLTVKTVMDTWTLQTGYPLVTVTRDYNKNIAEVTQHRFLKDEVKLKTDDGCWWIPLTYTDEKELMFNSTTPKSWLSCPKSLGLIENLPDNNSWIILNIQMGSLYKVNYDKKNWHLLSQTLNSENHNKIPILNKVQLLDDSYDLAWTGNLDYETFFDLLNYLRHENEYLPWKAALSNINSLNKHVKKSSIYGNFKVYMQHLIESIYQKIGGLSHVEQRNHLSAVKHKILINTWACRFQVADCVLEAQRLFKQYQQNSNNSEIISKELKNVIYCTAIKHGSEVEWNFLWTQYLKSNVATEKSTILSALACTKEIWLLRRYLEWSITANSGIRKQDSSTVFESIASNDVGFYIAKHFLQTKITDIYKYMGQNSRRLSRYLSSLAGQTTNNIDLQEFEKFIKENDKYLTEIKQGVEQSLETAKLNVQWQHKHFNDVKNVLKKYVTEKSQQ